MRIVAVSGLAVTFLLLAAHIGFADEGKFVGAVWKYQMSKVSAEQMTRAGAFRIDGTDIYQPRDKKPTKIGSIEGKKKKLPQKGDKVKVTFDTLRATDDTELKCSGQITWESFGEVHGRLIDSSGVHWNFKASRVQE